ncbi:MAG: YraN family protein [Parcubacteria group bacterium]|jgi:putative endonuclease
MEANPSLPGETGKLGEVIAANYLRRNGYEILGANFFNKFGYRRGEIDVIARDPESEEIAFVEVKTRKCDKNHPSNPEAAITRSKYHKLSRVISDYLRKNKLEESDYRLDAITVEIDHETSIARLRHLKNIYY